MSDRFTIPAGAYASRLSTVEDAVEGDPWFALAAALGRAAARAERAKAAGAPTKPAEPAATRLHPTLSRPA